MPQPVHRVKSKGSVESSTGGTWQDTHENSGTAPNYNSSDTLESIDYYVTPNFRQVQKTGGLLPVLPCTHKKANLAATQASYDYTLNSGYRSWGAWPIADRDCNDVGHLALTVDQTAILRQLLKEADARAKSPSFDLLTFLAELRESGKTIVNRANRLASASERLAWAARGRRTNWSKRNSRAYAAENLDRFTNMWLEGRYGWRPMYYDILSVMDAVQRTGALWSRGSASTTVEETQSWAESTAWSYLTWHYGVTQRTTYEYRAGRLYSLNPYSPHVSVDVLQTAWELTPWSFVVDHVLDIGTTLGSWMPRFGATYRQQWWSVRKTSSLDLSYSHYVSAASSGNNAVSTASCTIESVTGHREEYARSDGGPQPSSLPAVKVRIDDLFKVDLAALAIAKLRVPMILAGYSPNEMPKSRR